MTDPTASVITTAFVLAMVAFLVAAALRAWSKKGASEVRDVAAKPSPYEPPSVPPEPPQESPPAAAAGRVPVWFYRPFDLLGVGLVFVVFAGLVVASLQPSEAEPALDPAILVVNIGFQFMMAGLVAVIVVRRVGLVSWLGLRWRAWPRVLLIAPATVAFMWAVFWGLQESGYVEWMESLGVETVQDTVKLLQESKDPVVLGLMVFAAVIAAPICEEVVFRGYFYPVMKKFGGIPLATVCSALVFAAAHGSLTALLPLFLFGGVLVFLYEKTGSLWAPVAAHFCFNGATVLIQLAVRYGEISFEIPQ